MAGTNSLVKRFCLFSLIPFAMSKQKFFQKLSGYSLVPPSPGDLTQIADSVNDGVQVNKTCCLLIVDQVFPYTAYLCLKHWCIGCLRKHVLFQYCAILCTKENDCVGTKIVSGMCQLYKEASTTLSLDSGTGASPLYMMCVS